MSSLLDLVAGSLWAFQGGNASGNNAAVQPLPDRVKAISDIVQPDQCPFCQGVYVRNIVYKLTRVQISFWAFFLVLKTLGIAPL
jgi:hypothetical protein